MSTAEDYSNTKNADRIHSPSMFMPSSTSSPQETTYIFQPCRLNQNMWSDEGLRGSIASGAQGEGGEKFELIFCKSWRGM